MCASAAEHSFQRIRSLPLATRSSPNRRLIALRSFLLQMVLLVLGSSTWGYKLRYSYSGIIDIPNSARYYVLTMLMYSPLMKYASIKPLVTYWSITTEDKV